LASFKDITFTVKEAMMMVQNIVQSPDREGQEIDREAIRNVSQRILGVLVRTWRLQATKKKVRRLENKI